MAAMAELKRRRDQRRRSTPRLPTTMLRIVLVGAMCVVLGIIAGRAFDQVV